MQDSEDIRYMVGALEALGVQVEANWAAGTAVVHGCAGRFPTEGAELFLGNAGTAMRCICMPTPAACMQPYTCHTGAPVGMAILAGTCKRHAAHDAQCDMIYMPLQAAVRSSGSSRPWSLRTGRRRPHAGAADRRPGGWAEATGR